jgi:hypothetical protein
MSLDIPTAPIIKFRKNSESSVTKDGKSVMILETKEKKITVNLKDDKVFLNKKDFPKNIELMKSSISNIEKHSSDRSLVRIQKIKGDDALDGLEIEKKIIPEPANRSVIRSQEVEKAGELSKDKDEVLNIVEQCEQFQVDGVRLNTVGSRETKRKEDSFDSQCQKTRSFPEIKMNNLGMGRDKKIVPVQDSVDIRTELVRSKENDEEFIIPVEHNEEHFEYFKLCYICDKLHLTTTTFTSLGCEHTICLKCGKTFYEDKIEQGEFNLQCPIYRCTFCPDIEFIKMLLSDKHIQTFKKYLEAEDIQEMAKIKSNTQLEVRVYTQKHVFDINTNDTFFNYNKTKDRFCIKCGEPSLYGRTGKTYVKCLNCYNTICKFCMKAFTYDHLDITSMNYCKVYFRKTLKKTIEKESKLKLFILTYIMMIPSYVLFVFAMYSYIADAMSYLLCRKDKTIKAVKLIYLIMLMLIILILFPVFIILIPYFPVLIAVFK